MSCILNRVCANYGFSFMLERVRHLWSQWWNYFNYLNKINGFSRTVQYEDLVFYGKCWTMDRPADHHYHPSWEKKWPRFYFFFNVILFWILSKLEKQRWFLKTVLNVFAMFVLMLDRSTRESWWIIVPVSILKTNCSWVRVHVNTHTYVKWCAKIGATIIKMLFTMNI